MGGGVEDSVKTPQTGRPSLPSNQNNTPKTERDRATRLVWYCLATYLLLSSGRPANIHPAPRKR